MSMSGRFAAWPSSFRAALRRPRPLLWRVPEPTRPGALARRRAGRFLLFAAVVGAFLPALGTGVSAQGRNQLNICLDTRAFAVFRPGGDFAADGRPRGGGMTPGGSILQLAAVCATEFARDSLLPIGRRLFASLALIAVAWTGIQVLFAGSFSIGQVISLAFLLGFPFAVLESYANPVGTPWGDMTFPDMVGTMGSAIGGGLVGSSFQSLNDTLSDIAARLFSTEALRSVGLDTVSEQAGPDESLSGGGAWDTVSGLVGGALGLPAAIRDTLGFLLDLHTFVTLIALALLFIVLPAVVGYCSFLWGYVSYILAIILGPLLVPWILIPQLSFLSWGWFRSLVGASIHMLVASVCFAVAVQLLTVPLVRFSTVYLEDDRGLTALQHAFSLGASRVFLVFLESAPFLAIAWLGVFKVGEITNFIMSAGPMPEAGLSGRLGSAQRVRAIGGSASSVVTGGGGSAVRAAGGARAAAAAAGAARRAGGVARVVRR